MLKINTNKNELNIDFIYSFLSHSYWANNRTKEEVKKSIKNSLCFGMYFNNEQIGFARILTDKIVFSYLMDVFISPTVQGKGFGKELIKYIYNYPDLIQVKKHYLITMDAQEFYKKSGFTVYPTPERFMIKS